MRTAAFILLLVMLASVRITAQATTEQAATVAAAEKAAIAAITFRQGDAAGFSRARADFTAAGWSGLMKRMQGFLDANGAPTFTSGFAASGLASLLRERDGVVHVASPARSFRAMPLAKPPIERRSRCTQAEIRSGLSAWSRSRALAPRPPASRRPHSLPRAVRASV